jgi:hypothetical protein
MVIGAPRSGTAWAANWLSTGEQLCLHDPLWDRHYTEFDAIEHPRLGIACTAMARFHPWVNKHPAPKVILHRTPDLVNDSLVRLGLPPCPQQLFLDLWKIRGLHVEWTDLFNENAANLHAHLKLGPFDAARHGLLRDMRITANWQERQRRQNPEVVARIVKEMA